jgi:hypothetical protein
MIATVVMPMPTSRLLLHTSSSLAPLSTNELSYMHSQRKVKVISWKSTTLVAALMGLHSASISHGFVVSDAKISRTKALSSMETDCSWDDARRSIIFRTMGMCTLSAFAPPTIAVDKALSEEYRQGTAALAEMDDQAPVPREAYKKLPSNLIYADLRPGNGEEVKEGRRVNMQWVLRKSNGYFVDSSEVSGNIPFIFQVGDGNAIQGVDEGVRGMKAGGVRRLLIPPSLAYVQGLEDGRPGPLPLGFGPRQQMRRVMNVRKDVPGEYVYLEVQVTRVR